MTLADSEKVLEAWRTVATGFNPQTGISRTVETMGLMQLQYKRCKNAAETELIIREIDKRKKLIEEIGGACSDDMLIAVIWASMDPNTRSQVSAKMEATDVGFVELRAAVVQYTGLIGATTHGRGPIQWT